MPSRRKTQVPEQYLGYSLQPLRCLHLLLTAPPDATISLEVFEDVGQQQGSGATLASQTKSALTTNPVSDRAPELWKTLNNWMTAISTGLLDPATTVFEIYVASRKNANIARTFHDATTAQQATDAISMARTKLWGKPPRQPRRKKLSDELRHYTQAILDPTQAHATALIQHFQLTFGSGNPIADLRTAISNKWVRPESVDIALQHAHGWIKERFDTQLQRRQPAMIPVAEFNTEMLTFLPRCDFRHILLSVARKPPPEQVAAERVRTYVQQLELIESSDEDTIQAINDYLRAATERTVWSKAGIIHDDSLDEYEEALLTFWRNKKRQNTLTQQTLTPVQHGQLLYTDCCMCNQKLQGLEVPSYFTPGSYHALADDQIVGWHPEYKDKIKTNEKP